MKDEVGVKMSDPLKNLAEEGANVSFLEGVGLVFDESLEVCSRVLQRQIDAVLVVEYVIQTDYIRMLELAEELDFTEHCEVDSPLFGSGVFYLFESHFFSELALLLFLLLRVF